MAEQQQLRQRQATCPVSHTWVDASAGTGKTKILTDRILRFLLNETPASHILALTFTKAAATEMKTRILERLGHWAILDDISLQQDLMTLVDGTLTVSHLSKAKSLFTEVLDCPGGLKIQTIHQFCQDLLNRFPLEARIPLHYTLMNESEAQRLIYQSIDQLLYTEDLSRVLQHYRYAYVQECLAEILMSKDFFNLVQENIRTALQSFFQIDLSITPTEMMRTFSQSCPDWQTAAAILKDGSSNDQKLAQLLTHPFSYKQYIRGFLTQEGEIRQRLVSKQIDTSHPNLRLTLQQEAERIHAFNTSLKKQTLAQLSETFHHLAIQARSIYQSHKAAQSLMDFDDLILKTTELLNRDEIAPWILYKLDDQIDHILVDEAQDTNPLQWQIILKLAEDFFAGHSAREIPRTLFVVGDYKQSIYSFQGADPTLFSDLKQVIAEKSQQVNQRWQNISLDVSFRSCQAILDVVDAVFVPQNISQGVHENPHSLKHQSNRPLDGGRIELWPIIQDTKTADTPYVLTASQRLARQIAAEIKQWLNNQRQIPAKARAVEPKDIMILVQRRHGFMYELIRSLKKQNIPVAGPDRLYLVDQLYIQDLIAFGRFLLLPNDDYNLACLLKSPLFNLSEEDLLELCAHRGERSLWAELNQQSLNNACFKDTQELLTLYLNKVDYFTPYQIYAHLLCVSQGRQKFFTRFEYEIADGLDEFLNLALEFETQSLASLELFLAELLQKNPEIKRDFSSGDLNAVRITTVHGSKGLQAPIIILPDTTFVPQTLPALLWDPDNHIPLWNAPKHLATEALEKVQTHYQTKQEEEYRRLLYVALTRAEDELYIYGWENTKESALNCWYSLIRDGMRRLGAQDIYDKLVIETPQRQRKDAPPQVSVGDPFEHIPAWLFSPAKQEKISTRFLSPSTVGQTAQTVISPLDLQNVQSYQDGLILHKLLELLPNIARNERSSTASHVFKQFNLPPQKHPEYFQLIDQILQDQSFKAIFGPQSYAEVPIVGHLAGEKFSGQIDRLVVLKNEIVIIDFKSDQHPPQTPTLVDQRYRQQLSIYKQLLQQIYPQHKITCQILWIRTKSLMTIPMDSKETSHAAA